MNISVTYTPVLASKPFIAATIHQGDLEFVVPLFPQRAGKPLEAYLEDLDLDAAYQMAARMRVDWTELIDQFIDFDYATDLFYEKTGAELEEQCV